MRDVVAFPASFAQSRLWIIDQLNPESPTYNIPLKLRLHGYLDVNALEQSFNDVIQRHEVLRTTLASHEGQLIQLIAPFMKLKIQIIDLDSINNELRESHVEKLAIDEARRPFDLAKGPLLRASLLRLSKEDTVLLITVHHIVFDAWSISILNRDMAAFYTAHVRNRPVDLPELPIQYADFACWQRTYLQGELLDEQLAYWRQQLADVPTVLTLPTDRPRPSVQTFQGASLDFNLSPDLTHALRNLSQSENVTLFMTLLAAFQTLLARYSGQDDIVVGTPIAGRTRTEVEGLIGFFVNTLVLRTKLDGNPTFRELLQRVRDIALGAYAHQDLPFERLVEELRPERSASYTPLVQVSFALDNVPKQELHFPNLTVKPLRRNSVVSRYDLSITMIDRDDFLSGSVEYSSDLFDEDTINRLIGHFQILLKGLVEDAERRPLELPILDKEERRLVLAEWNNTRNAYPRNLLAHELFSVQAALTPNALAVKSGKQEITYGDLERSANQLARYLCKYGVGPETLVGICLERSIEWVIAALAVFKAGGAHVCLDPVYPAERLDLMIRDASPLVVITLAQFRSRLLTSEVQYVLLDEDRRNIEFESSNALELKNTPKNAAYVTYTSGSSGIPKAVITEHGGLLNLVFWTRRTFSVSPLDRGMQTCHVSLDGSNWEVWSYLTAGASLHIVDNETHLSSSAIRKWILDEKISIGFLAPVLAEDLIVQEWPAETSLRILMSGSDRLVVYPREDLPFTYVNIYGPTECTVFQTAAVVLPKDDSNSPPLIGRPLSNLHTYVVDKYLQPVPIGVPGELLLGGDGLARGYLNQPALTASKFVPDPFSGEAGSRLYRTGDLVRWRSDGQLEFIGRVDNQVKIRGFRIELGDVEAALSQYPAIREVVVVPRESETGVKRLIGYIVPAGSKAAKDFNVTDLRLFLAKKLPDYMIPSAFMLLDALPVSPQGKVNRKALPVPDEAHPMVGSNYVAPNTPIEETLVAIWSEILGVKNVGIHDNFFELGGDSILAIRLITRANELRLGLTPSQVFQCQTISELAAVANRSKKIEVDQDLVLGEVPLTPIQVWFFEQKFSEPHHWNQALVLKATEPIDPALLRSAFSFLLSHHDALRMRYIADSNGWKQFIADTDENVPFEIVDLPRLPSKDQKVAFRKVANQHQASLSFTNGPVFRAILFNYGPHDHSRLLIIAHHLVIDNISWSILREDLETAYQQLKRGETVQLPPKTNSFQTWASRLNDLAKSFLDGNKLDLDYWLSGKRPDEFSLPLDYPPESKSNLVGSAKTVSASLSAEETNTLLKQIPNVFRTQINDVLLTALVEAFAQWTSRRSLFITLEGHGREPLFPDIDISRTIGWFASSSPIWLNIEGVYGTRDALRAVKKQLRTIPQHGMGYGILRYLATNDMSAQILEYPEPEISFNYLGHSPAAFTKSTLFEPASEPAGLLRHPLGKRPYLIEINAMIAHGRFVIRWRFSKNLFKPTTIEQLAENFVKILRSYIKESQLPNTLSPKFADFPALTLDQSTLEHLLLEYANIEDIYPLSPTQQGMLFESLYAPTSGVYVEHWIRILDEPLDPIAFRHAWQRVVERHPVFRSAFVWDRVKDPLQLVQGGIKLQWDQYDWRGLTITEQTHRLTAFLEADQRRGFDLSKAPLMRVTLIALGENRYECIWTVHHLLLDGWSIPIVLKEVFAFYDAFREGKELYLEETRPYRDYILWLQQQDTRSAEKYWKEKLAGFTAPTRIEVESGESLQNISEANVEAQELNLSVEFTTILKTFARQNHLTLNTLFQGAWALLLSRYSRETDVLFGTVVSGRSADLPRIDSMIGLVMNTIPVRVTIPVSMQLLPWLQQLQQEQTIARQYEHSALLEVQSWSQIPHGLPLFETVLVFENYPEFGETSSQTRGEVVNRTLIRSFGQTHYPLSVLVFPGETLSVRVSYNKTRFHPAVINRLLSHLQALLEGMVANPSQFLGRLPLLPISEQEIILKAWNETSKDYDWNTSLIKQFHNQVKLTPEATAFIFGNQTLKYRDLDQKANHLAARLLAFGVGPEVFVGLCMERCLDLPVGLIGILKAGGVYVPLDPDYPKERLALMIEDSRPPVILTHRHLADRLPLLPYQCIYLDDEENVSESNVEPTGQVISQVTANNLAYVMYTSGSTGRPKGAALEHKQLLNRFAWMWEAYPFTPDDVICQKTSINFVDSVWEMLGPLLKGIPSAIVPEAVYRDTDALIETLAKYKVTRIWLLPSVLSRLLVIPGLADRLPHLKYWVMGGEVLTVDLIQLFCHCLPNRVLINLYGSSELFDATAHNAMETLGRSTNALIGTPIANTRTYVLDAQLQPLPIGVAGELYVGGVCLPRCYLNQPELTATRFIPDPFSDEPSSRLFRTGDLARYRTDGTLECLGRIDNQVKIRGYRIELGEIEAILDRHPDILKSAIVLREDDPTSPSLIAYIITKSGKDVASNEIRLFLKEWLPDYMIPSSFVRLDTFPRTPSGKIDRRLLPVPMISDLVPLGTPFIEPKTSTESILASIFADVLQIERVGVNDNFFDLGGHSLLAIKVISRIREELEIEMPIRIMFDTPTIASISSHIAQAASTSTEIPRRPRSIIPPLSFAQQRLWFLDQLYPGNSNYNIHLAYRIEGPLDVPVLEYCMNDLMIRHESLRTIFSLQYEEPRQIIASSLILSIKKLSFEDQRDAEQRALEEAKVEVSRPFNLLTGPLIRALLIKLSPTLHIFVITIHHILSDGWSLETLSTEIGKFYTGRIRNRPVDLPELPIQYADFACWQRTYLQGELLEEQLAYWRQQLADAPTVLALPTDRPHPSVQTFQGASIDFSLSPELTQALRNLSQSENVTLFMTLLAAFQTLLARYSGQDDIVVGTPIAGRTRTEVEGLIGFFVNTLVLRTKLDGNPTFRELLHRVRDVALGAYAHQDLPFEKLVQELRPERTVERNPIFQVLINFVSSPQSIPLLSDLNVQPINLGNQSIRFPITLYIHDLESELLFRLNYQTEIFSSQLMREVANQFIYLLTQIAKNPELPISAYSLVTVFASSILPDPTSTLTEEFYPPVQKVFLNIVRKQPHLSAVLDKEKTWTYFELAQCSGFLARLLRENGVEHGDVVAIVGSRSFGCIASMLAVLLAGGVLLTLDARLPAQRKLQMLLEANCQHIIETGYKQTDFSWLPNGKYNIISWSESGSNQYNTFIALDDIEALASEINPSDPAYIFFTSGTMGYPKAILGSNKGLSHFLAWQKSYFNVGPGDRSAQLTGLSFDVLLRDVFLPLSSGATLCLPDDPDDLSADQILPWLDQKKITLLHTVPSIVTSWLHSYPEGVTLKSLRQIFFAGEPLSEALVNRWRATFPQAGDIVNLYGPTETSLAKLYYQVPSIPAPGNQPVGTPMPGAQALILAPNGHLCGIGEPGEIVIRTPYRSLGYLGKQNEPRQRFTKNHFRNDDSDILYWTGDLGRYRDDGILEILGRLDDQVKIRGIRVEPSEVTALLMQHPSIQECVVVTHERAEGEKVLVAYIVPSEETILLPADMRRFLTDFIPDYMLPTGFVFLEHLPLTANGKVDRRALPVPTFSTSDITPYNAPKNMDEVKLARIWANVLGLDQIGIHDNFFELGGHSLLATRLIWRVRDTFNVNVPLRAIFESPTIAEFAVAIQNAPQQLEKRRDGPILALPRELTHFAE